MWQYSLWHLTTNSRHQSYNADTENSYTRYTGGWIPHRVFPVKRSNSLRIQLRPTWLWLEFGVTISAWCPFVFIGDFWPGNTNSNHFLLMWHQVNNKYHREIAVHQHTVTKSSADTKQNKSLSLLSYCTQNQLSRCYLETDSYTTTNLCFYCSVSL